MALELITPPAIEPIAYQQVIDHLRINPYDEVIDEASIAYIETLISAVRFYTEDFLNRALITQTWKYYLDKWPRGNYIEILKPPLQSVSSITVLTDDPVPVINYLIDTVSNRGRIVLAADESWPGVTLYPVNPIQIEFICGYGDLAEDVPERIRQAMLIEIADLYNNRETIVPGQPIQKLNTYERLLGSYRIFYL